MNGEIKPGTRIRFRSAEYRGGIKTDTVRAVFWQETLSQSGVAFVLTEHSWCWASDMTGLERGDTE